METQSVLHFPTPASTKGFVERETMATTVGNPNNPARSLIGLPGRRYDHLFFSSMAFLMLATVFLGFAKTYFLAGVFRAPLPSLTVHLHGAAFSCWIVLLITQTSLVSAGRVDIHRRLGIGGFLLACLMVVLGILVATGSLARAAGLARQDAQTFYIIPITDMLIFATLVFFAFRARFDPPTHKRLIFVATTSLLIAAVARWPFAFISRHAPVAALLTYIFLLILVAYDLWSMRKVHRATIWAIAFLVFVQQIRLPIGKTAAWHAFAAWVQSHDH
jgi:FtsH-binding integral membrane protein